MIRVYCIVFFFQLLSLTGASESGIVGGLVAKPHSRPYMASLQFNGHHSCGGILIREDFVLTAAHCKDCSYGMTVVLGAHNLKRKEKSQQKIHVAEYFRHPNYKDGMDYDIMLLKLENKAKLNKYVKTIGLPEEDEETPTDVNCDVAGWGKTGLDKPASDVLKETTEKTLDPPECKRIWQTYFNSDHMVCTNFTEGKGGVCQGDSGGPLICNNKPQGLTAFTLGSDCTDTRYPHVFIKIPFFIPWIKEVMKGSGNVA